MLCRSAYIYKALLQNFDNFIIFKISQDFFITVNISIAGSKGGLQVASAPLQQNGNQISIFCDEDASAGSQQQGAASEWKHLPSRKESQKENVQSAGQWAGQRVSDEVLGTHLSACPGDGTFKIISR